MPLSRPPNWTSRLRAVAVVAMVTMVIAIGGYKTLHDPEAGPPVGEREGAGELVAEYRACQTFRAEYDGLDQIQVLLNDLGRRNRSTFHFGLHDTDPDGAILISLDQDASEVNSNVYHVLSFAPIEDSAGQRYAFCLSAPTADLAQAITVLGTVRDTYPEGRAVFTPGMWGAGRIADLSFHLDYDHNLWEQAAVLASRLGAGKPSFPGAGWFYALLIIVYLALLYLLFLYRPTDQEEHPDG